MTTQATPGVTLKYITRPEGIHRKMYSEPYFVFDLSKMTLATALADPRLPHDPMSSWTIEQLFKVMLEPGDIPGGQDNPDYKELRPIFIDQFRESITDSEYNKDATKHTPKNSTSNRTVTAFRSTYTDPESPDTVEPTIIIVSAHKTVLQTKKYGSRSTSRIRDDLFKLRAPSAGFIEYLQEFRRQRLNPLKKLIAKNDADVQKVLTAMAHVQQISLALSFAQDCSMHDRSKLWHDFFDTVGSLGITYSIYTKQELKDLFLKGDELWDEHVEAAKLGKIESFKTNQLDLLINELGKSAVWAHAGEVDGVSPCASAKERDDDAKRLLTFLRKDDVILDALANWDGLHVFEQWTLGGLLEDLFGAFAECPGAMRELLKSELLAVARGSATAVTSIPALPQETSRQAALAKAISEFDPHTALAEKPNKLTKVIRNAFKQYGKTRKIAPPIISIWAHSTPSILARFDKLTPDRINPQGTAYLLRSVFGMGLLTEEEMKELWSDLDEVLESAVDHGIKHKKTKKRLDQMFNVDLSHGKYPVRSSFLTEKRLYNAIKLAVGVLGIRQGFISVVDDKTVSQEDFLEITTGVLSIADGASELRTLLRDASSAGRSALRRKPSFLGQLTPAVLISRLTAVVSLISAYHTLSKTDESSIERDFATADVAVAWISLSLIAMGSALGTTFPVAGLALILLRWVIFDQDLWNKFGGVAADSPAVKLVQATAEKIENQHSEMGKFLRLAPNWDTIATRIKQIRLQAPRQAEKVDATKLALYFHLETDHADAVRKYAQESYGLTPEVATLIIED